jgi:Icc-related predicted phosphoesterase
VFICAADDIHGAMVRLYDDVQVFEAALGIRFDWVLHVGDFGVWPDPARIDRASRNHDGAGDFAGWLADGRRAPRSTVFIKGNHEDFAWLDAQRNLEVLPGLIYLRNGRTIDLNDFRGQTIRVGGVGGCYGPSDYARPSQALQGYSRRHYTHDEVNSLASASHVDIVLTHDAPAGVRFERSRGSSYISEAAGLDALLARLRPRVCLFGHHHARVDAEISGVRCIGLNKVGCRGSLVALEIDSQRRDCSLLGEFSGRRCSSRP